ncbi:hypothetical protein CGS49_03425 [Faecalibacterium langellae]|uniref:Uncharacterized protein n=1 Tax=Faecalibacterium langellae TaxID=3435293 RepID=A0ACC9D187_9FIRM|nr:hypothetical protein CGS49_03425 [Faecalibacterium prausnitzii]
MRWQQGSKREGRPTGSFLLGRGSGHSIARPIAFGNRVPPQRTVLGETTRRPAERTRYGPTCENAFGAALRLRSNEKPQWGFQAGERSAIADGRALP